MTMLLAAHTRQLAAALGAAGAAQTDAGNRTRRVQGASRPAGTPMDTLVDPPLTACARD